MYSIADAVVSALSLVTLGYVILATRVAFKKHYLNVFSHLMLILIVVSLLSKHLTHLTKYFCSALPIFPDTS